MPSLFSALDGYTAIISNDFRWQFQGKELPLSLLTTLIPALPHPFRRADTMVCRDTQELGQGNEFQFKIALKK